MSYHEKIRVGVLRGGPSSEYEISLRTGATVIKHLPEQYHPFDIFIDRQGRWHFQGAKQEPHRILSKLDLVFNALHGEYGENGEVQHLLETYCVPFSGSGRFASAMAQNKALAKAAVGTVGIKTPHHIVIHKEEVGSIDSLAARLYRSFPQPTVIKPMSKGSSIGVAIAGTLADIAHALDLAFALSESVLAEEYISGKEATCAVLEQYRGEAYYAFLPVEVVLPPESRFFDYYAKFSTHGALICPGNFTPEEKEEVQELARKAHQALGLRHYSRSDFIIHPKRGIYFLEADSLPDMVEETSPFIKSIYAVGGTIPHFLDHVVQLSLAGR